MPVIKSYYQTTPMTDEQLVDAINRIDERSSRLETRVDELFSLINRR